MFLKGTVEMLRLKSEFLQEAESRMERAFMEIDVG